VLDPERVSPEIAPGQSAGISARIGTNVAADIFAVYPTVTRGRIHQAIGTLMFNAITRANRDPRPRRSALSRASNAFVPRRTPRVPNNRDAHECPSGRCEHHRD
jgi:hypothetical protein